MTEVEGKMKLPVVDRGYDIAATDAYISMLQEEYNKIYAWGSELEKRAEAPAGEAASSEEIEASERRTAVYITTAWRLQSI